ETTDNKSARKRPPLRLANRRIGWVEPTLPNPPRHRRQDHRGHRLLAITARLIDDLPPHAIGSLQRNQPFHLAPVDREDPFAQRMRSWNCAESLYQTECRKSVAAAPRLTPV